MSTAAAPTVQEAARHAEHSERHGTEAMPACHDAAQNSPSAFTLSQASMAPNCCGVAASLDSEAPAIFPPVPALAPRAAQALADFDPRPTAIQATPPTRPPLDPGPLYTLHASLLI